MSAAARTYRFPARDRSGWLLGLQAAQCIILGVGVFAGGILLNVGAPAPVIVLAVSASGVAAFAPVGGRPGYTWLPVMTMWLLGRRHSGGTWIAPVPRFRAGQPDRAAQPHWPRFVGKIEIHDHFAYVAVSKRVSRISVRSR